MLAIRRYSLIADVLCLMSISSGRTIVSNPIVRNQDRHERLQVMQAGLTDDFSSNKPQGALNLDKVTTTTLVYCGTPEFRGHGREKRFVPHSDRWPNTRLTWKLIDPYKLLNKFDYFTMRNVLHRAFDLWSMASGGALKFLERRTRNKFHTTDITVYFAKGPHNDTLPFDGKYGVVAHGFYPTDGNLHFDAEEYWTLDMSGGINVFQTAVHEIGHLLGMEHSHDSRAAMFPINRPYDPNYRLSEDDVRGIRYLYTPWKWQEYLRAIHKQQQDEDLESFF